MNAVLGWVKSNAYIVIFIVVMIVAPVGLGIVSSKMNETVRENVKQRASKLADLKKLEKTNVSITVPGSLSAHATMLVNNNFNRDLASKLAKVKADSDRIHGYALEFNRKGRGVLLSELFPRAPVHQRETLPMQMHREIVLAYEKLLDDIDAGSAPAVEKVEQELIAARERATDRILIKAGGADLNEEERRWLQEELTRTRLTMYAAAAERFKVYATLGAIGVPQQSETPVRADDAGATVMFYWQWDFWLKQDILQAIGEANGSAESVIDAPVKRLLGVEITDQISMASAGGAATGGGQQGGGTGFGLTGGSGLGKRDRGGGQQGGGRRPAGGSRGGSAPAAGSGGAPINPAAEVSLDYGISFTGRTTNPLYDVRTAIVDLVVDSERIPEVLDALSQRNFMTILDIDLQPVDPFADIGEGYFYFLPPGQVSHLTLTLETLWMREWTHEFMPDALKGVLGIPLQQFQQPENSG